MKKLFILLFCFFSVISKADVWTAKAGYPHMSCFNIFFSISGKGYVGAGNSFTPFKDFWEFDPVINVWTQKADYGGGFMWAGCSFSIDRKGYAGLGLDTTTTANHIYTRHFWEYDPVLNLWTQKADFGGSGRTLPVFFSTADRGYVGMGGDSLMVLQNDLWEYNPVTDTWTQKLSLPGNARDGSGSFVINDIAYVVNGEKLFAGLTHEVWAYNIKNDFWIQKNNTPFVPRACCVTFSLCNKGYCGTGFDGSGLTYLNDFWQYNPASDTWIQKTAFAGNGRQSAAYFTINEKAYVGNGANHTNVFIDFYEYTPDNYCVTNLNETTSADIFQTSPNPTTGYISVKLNDGKLLTDVMMIISDLKGNICQQKNYTDAISEIKIKTTDLAPGIYLLQLQSGDLNFVERIVVQ